MPSATFVQRIVLLKDKFLEVGTKNLSSHQLNLSFSLPSEILVSHV